MTLTAIIIGMKIRLYTVLFIALLFLELLVVLGGVLGIFFLRGIDDSDPTSSMTNDFAVWFLAMFIVGALSVITYKKRRKRQA